MILNKIHLLVFGMMFFFGGLVTGQELLPVMYDSTLVNHQVIMNGSFLQHGSSLSNEISRKFIFGGEISDELSQKAYERQKDYNRIGGGAKFRLAYKAATPIFKSKPYWSWMIDVSNNIHGSADYSSDIFGLAFLGNKSFLGESVNFSNSSAQYVQYLSVGGGIHNRKSKNFISLNAVFPQDYFQVKVDKGNISFAEDGSQYDLKLQAEMMEAASAPYFKGLGAAVNFDFNIPFGTSKGYKGIIKISGRNVGAYHLRNTKKSKINTEQSYGGFQINDFSSETELSSLKDTLGVRESTNSATKVLPGFIQIGKVTSVHSLSKVQSFFGVRMYTNLIYRPMVYAGVHYQPVKSFSLGAQGSFGGYGNFRLGLYANYTAENLMIGIGTEDLLGALLVNQYGHSGLIRLAWKL